MGAAKKGAPQKVEAFPATLGCLGTVNDRVPRATFYSAEYRRLDRSGEGAAVIR